MWNPQSTHFINIGDFFIYWKLYCVRKKRFYISGNVEKITMQVWQKIVLDLILEPGNSFRFIPTIIAAIVRRLNSLFSYKRWCPSDAGLNGWKDMKINHVVMSIIMSPRRTVSLISRFHELFRYMIWIRFDAIDKFRISNFLHLFRR